ncbi:trafficking particle complex subunit 8, putative [Babesia ovata]|uniref:Trafficking particle complex subunit 8, putative n=1 Tax=Babesia ovata TaxID=189622 RepID=A0A2H6KC50_9APIC|nr:trafficking particle complex subunit 8, putative [Babesia ovata]GBE60571.1 trafficking particle complex subunit 8, putative [Babesia ovata]
MVVPVCSRAALFERLWRRYHGSCILVRATDAAREAITAGGFKSCTQVIEDALDRDTSVGEAAKLEFNCEETLGEGDLDTHLLNAIADNTPDFCDQDIDFDGYPPWFVQWAFTLAKITRCARNKTLDIHPDERGIIAFCSSAENAENVINILKGSESTTFRCMVVMGERNADEFIDRFKSMYQDDINHYVVNSDEAPLRSCIADDGFVAFISKIADLYLSEMRTADSQLKDGTNDPHVPSKTVKGKPSNTDASDTKSLLLMMNSELQSAEPTGCIDEICRGTEQEIQGVAFVYSAVLHMKAINNASISHNDKAEDSAGNVLTADKAIADFDKAISIFQKYGAKWDALLTAVLMATVGGDLEARRLGAISATMDLKSNGDYARAALSLELCTFFTEKIRKKMFHLVMAGHLYLQSGLLNLTKRCYMLAVPIYQKKGWGLASDFLYGTLSRYDPLYCIDALNGLADRCEMVNCHKYMKNYDEDFLKSPWYSGEREMTHLRRLMKLSVADHGEETIKNKNSKAIVSCAYGPYPALVYGLDDGCPLGESLPYLVRVPVVLLRNSEGVPGQNCGLLRTSALYCAGGDIRETSYNTADDFEEQEAAINKEVKKKAEANDAWKPYYEFISDYGNISYRVDPDSGYTLPKQRTKSATNYQSGEESVIKLELVNPLHIGIHCDDFHLLINGADEKWWEKATVVSVLAGQAEVTQAKPKDNFVYLSEGERRHVYLKFKVTKPGVFRVTGLGWKLFGCVSCWVPLYLCGQRKTKGAPLDYKEADALETYLKGRLPHAGLSLSVRDYHPEVGVALSKVTRLPSNARTLDEDSEHFDIVKQFMCEPGHGGKYMFEDGYLTMDDAIDGEYVITELAIKNLGDLAIDSLTLNVKSSGRCHMTNRPIAYSAESCDVRIVWEDMARCNLGSISGHKAYQVTLRSDSEMLISPNGTLSIFMLVVPRVIDVLDVLCIQGRLKTTSSKHKSEGHVAFWRFYATERGINVCYDFDHSLPKIIRCHVANNSKQDVKSLSFYDTSGQPLKTRVRSPTYMQTFDIIGLRKGSQLSSVIPFNAEDSKLILRWECGHAFGVVTSNINIDSSARVLVKVRSEIRDMKYERAPMLARVEFVFENPTDETIPPMQLEAIPNLPAECHHKWFYVGTLTAKVPAIPPKCSKCVGFDVLLPLPGVYLFAGESINIAAASGVFLRPCEQFMVSVES